MNRFQPLRVVQGRKEEVWSSDGCGRRRSFQNVNDSLWGRRTFLAAGQPDSQPSSNAIDWFPPKFTLRIYNDCRVLSPCASVSAFSTLITFFAFSFAFAEWKPASGAKVKQQPAFMPCHNINIEGHLKDLAHVKLDCQKEDQMCKNSSIYPVRSGLNQSIERRKKKRYHNI